MWFIIGVLPWLIIIWLIIPESFIAIVVILLICALGILVLWLLAKITDKKTEGIRTDREKAIQEWEKKWKRPHPSRIINCNRNNLKQSK